MVKRLLVLNSFAVFEDAALLAFRMFIGSFLVWGVWDNIVSAEQMAEFAGFLAQHGFVKPHLMAPLSVWAQFICGVSFALGIATRWAGLLCAFNFIVAIVMVDGNAGIRAAFPAAMLVIFGLYLMARGSGKFGLDALLRTDAEPQNAR